MYIRYFPLTFQLWRKLWWFSWLNKVNPSITSLVLISCNWLMASSFVLPLTFFQFSFWKTVFLTLWIVVLDFGPLTSCEASSCLGNLTWEPVFIKYFISSDESKMQTSHSKLTNQIVVWFLSIRTLGNPLATHFIKKGITIVFLSLHNPCSHSKIISQRLIHSRKLISLHLTMISSIWWYCFTYALRK